MKKVIPLFLLSVLLVACVPSQPTTTVSTEDQSMLAQTTSSTDPTKTKPFIPTPEITPTASANKNLAMERVSLIQGNINGIVVSGDIAYVGMGLRVAAIDIQKHEKPWLYSQSEPLPGAVSLMLLIPGEPDPFLLVNADRHLVVLDLSTPDTFTPIQQLELAGNLTAMIFDPHANILYAGGKVDKNTGFISAIEITPERQMKVIQSIDMPEFPLSLGLAEGSLFAGAEGYQGGLYHIQLASPGKLSPAERVIESTPIRPFQPFSLQVIGKRLYVSYKAIEAYDINDPEQPQQVWMINVGGHVVREFRVVGGQIYWFGWTIKSENMYEVIDAPEAIPKSSEGMIASCTAMHDNAFLIAYEGFEIYETSQK